MDVKYFGNGTIAIVLGEGDPRQVDDGRGNVQEVATTRIVNVDPSWVEDVDSDQLLDERPELHPHTGRPLSETEDVESGAKIDPRGGPNASELEAEIARLRAENADYRAAQDRSGSTQTAADQQPENAGTPVVGSPATTEPPADATSTTTEGGASAPAA